MPELPDLAIVADALHAALAGRAITTARAPGPLAVRGTPAELDALVGQRLTSIRRRGKLLMANSTPVRCAAFAPLLDVMGIEVNWLTGDGA